MKKIEIPSISLSNVERGFAAPASFALWAGESVLKDTETGPMLMIGNGLTSDAEECSGQCMADIPSGGYVSPGDDLLDAVQERITEFRHTDTRVHRMLELAAELSMSEQSDRFHRGGLWGYVPSPFSPMPGFRTVAQGVLVALSEKEKMSLIGLHRFRLEDGSTRIVASARGATESRSVTITLEGEEPALIVHHRFGLGYEQIGWHAEQLPEAWNREEMEGSIYAVLNGQITTDNLF